MLHVTTNSFEWFSVSTTDSDGYTLKCWQLIQQCLMGAECRVFGIITPRKCAAFHKLHRGIWQNLPRKNVYKHARSNFAAVMSCHALSFMVESHLGETWLLRRNVSDFGPSSSMSSIYYFWQMQPDLLIIIQMKLEKLTSSAETGDSMSAVFSLAMSLPPAAAAVANGDCLDESQDAVAGTALGW